jgi:hypothetical protein
LTRLRNSKFNCCNIKGIRLEGDLGEGIASLETNFEELKRDRMINNNEKTEIVDLYRLFSNYDIEMLRLIENFVKDIKARLDED